MSDVWTVELEKEESILTAELIQQSGEGYTLPMAGPDVLGGVKPVQKTDDMTKKVGIDENGRLWSEKESEQVIEEVIEKYLQKNPIISEETDPTVPEWAKQPEKPTYTAEEVGALPADTIIPEAPTKTSQLENDNKYVSNFYVHFSASWGSGENYVLGECDRTYEEVLQAINDETKRVIGIDDSGIELLHIDAIMDYGITFSDCPFKNSVSYAIRYMIMPDNKVIATDSFSISDEEKMLIRNNLNADGFDWHTIQLDNTVVANVRGYDWIDWSLIASLDEEMGNTVFSAFFPISTWVRQTIMDLSYIANEASARNVADRLDLLKEKGILASDSITFAYKVGRLYHLDVQWDNDDFEIVTISKDENGLAMIELLYSTVRHGIYNLETDFVGAYFDTKTHQVVRKNISKFYWEYEEDINNIKTSLESTIQPPETASVGQTVVVKAVDENGKPTEWEAADFPVSGEVKTKIITIADFTFENDLVISVDDTDDINFGDAVVNHRHYFYLTPEGEQIKAKRIYGYIQPSAEIKIPASLCMSVYYRDGAPHSWDFGDFLGNNTGIIGLTSGAYTCNGGSWLFFEANLHPMFARSGVVASQAWEQIRFHGIAFKAIDTIIPHFSGVKITVSSGSLVFPAGTRFVLKAEVEDNA